MNLNTPIAIAAIRRLLNSASAVIKSVNLCSAYSKRISSEVIPTSDDRIHKPTRWSSTGFEIETLKKEKLLPQIAWKPVSRMTDLPPHSFHVS